MRFVPRVVAGLLAAWRAHAIPQNIDLRHLLLTVLAWGTGLLLVSMLLPDSIEKPIQEFIGWCLAGTVAAVALLASVKGLEDFLDS